jgi:hypothetical protein
MLIPSSSGLSGSEVSLFFARRGLQIIGIDNNSEPSSSDRKGMLAGFAADLQREIPSYRHEGVDIRDRQGVLSLSLPAQVAQTWSTVNPSYYLLEPPK